MAGGGDLPVSVARNAVDLGKRIFVIRLAGFADAEDYRSYDGADVSIGEIGRLIELLRESGCTDVVFAGIVSRPDFSKLRLDWRGARELPRLVSAASKGDDALLRAVLAIFEAEGFNIVGAESVAPSNLTPAGLLGARSPSEADMIDMRVAARAAAAIGELDIGQGAVSCDGVILALEAQEGTDQMLLRCAAMPEDIRGTPGNRKGVLVKRPKPIQDNRIDLPTIGARTIENAATAGLSGVALAADQTLILDMPTVVQRANTLGLFLYGFTAGELD
ncbi:MAG: UDP-2,3-diacylglucosamine diphosphatase LpxI [Hyphomonadaceae bacterium]